MTRHYANIATSIWRDDSFRCLSPHAQRVYVLLITQPDITAAGTLPITLRRWAALSAGTTPTDIEHALIELEAARFLVIDWDAEELLVRSFVRWDNGYGNPKRRPVILRAAKEVTSPDIQRAIAVEFDRLSLPTDDLPDTDDGSLPDRQADSLSGSPSASDGVVVTKGPYVEPQPSTHNTQPVERAAKPREASDSFNEFWAAYPRKVGRKAAVKAYATALKATDAQTLIAAAHALAAHHRARGTEQQYIPHATTWLNQGRWEDQADAEPVESVDEAEKRMRALTEGQPPCDHHMPGGRIPHPRTGQPLCPLCRRDLPPDFDDDPATTPEPVMAALDVYRANRTGPLDAHTLHVVTAEALALHARGVGQDLLTALAATAAQAGTSLLTAATRTEHHVA